MSNSVNMTVSVASKLNKLEKYDFLQISELCIGADLQSPSSNSPSIKLFVAYNKKTTEQKRTRKLPKTVATSVRLYSSYVTEAVSRLSSQIIYGYYISPIL